jgi:GTP cyclohydrolase III
MKDAVEIRVEFEMVIDGQPKRFTAIGRGKTAADARANAEQALANIMSGAWGGGGGP